MSEELLGLPQIIVEGTNFDISENVLSFEHRLNMPNRGNYGATLRILDPENKFEEDFVNSTAAEAITRYQENYAAQGDSGNPEDTRDEDYVKSVIGASTAGPRRGAPEITVRYGYPGNSSSNHTFIVAGVKISYNQGVKELELDLTYIPFNPDTDELEKIIDGSPTGDNLVISGKSDPIPLGESAANVNHHTYIKQAYERYAKALYNYDRVVALIPDMNKVLKRKVDIIEFGMAEGNPTANARAIAKSALSEAYSSIGMSLCEFNPEFDADIENSPLIEAQVISSFKEIEKYQSSDQAINAEVNYPIFVKMEHRVPSGKRFKGAKDVLSEVLGHMGRYDEFTTDFFTHVGRDGTFYVGDRGMINTVLGTANAESKFNSVDTSYIRKEASTSNTPKFNLNTPEDANIISLNYEEQSFFVNLIDIAAKKAKNFISTNQRDPKLKTEANANAESTDTIADYGYEGTLPSRAIDAAAKNIYAAANVLSGDEAETKAKKASEGLVAKTLPELIKLNVVTTPQFDVSEFGDILKTVQVNGVDVALAGEQNQTMTAHYSGKYQIYGITHTINESGATSRFRLLKGLQS